MGEKPNLRVVTPSAATGTAATQWWCPLCGTTAEKVSGSESCTCLAHGSPVAMLEVLENQPLPSTPTPIGMETGAFGSFAPYTAGMNRVLRDEVDAPSVTYRTLHKKTAKGWRLDETSTTVSFTLHNEWAMERARALLREAQDAAYVDGTIEAERRNSAEQDEA